jgi:hypothetical protein
MIRASKISKKVLALRMNRRIEKIERPRVR